MNATTSTPPAGTRPPDPIRRFERACTDALLEEAGQLRDLLRHQIVAARVIGHTSVSMTLDDAEALDRLLTDSLRQAEQLGVL
jgi:hypothetical protein